MIEQLHKTCAYCKKTLSTDCFYVDKSKGNQYLSSYCKECNRLKKRELRRDPRIKELERQNRRRYLAKPGKREKHNELNNERMRRHRLRKKLEKEMNR